ncbi:diguanylate cyclase (GGDEF)-like protein/PAS domain S-box-containing protein [Methylohalomonas lacus]|uniref:Diguanylate cyclase (GGDEF)-like protein/PAS domain S-box-containing protein n=1 Tax=Methylohalomonas lacus TaxID=398773 RepID=A0AAE3HKB3_9GAMM|nr:GGDEF domain-containing protein [Methylohalomonas lacus]MCS3902778.1 diguanylate cyclase (GGDEF)-like protein/PAS domain S-box-containing protein [Methylohalomonas lacus]
MTTDFRAHVPKILDLLLDAVCVVDVDGHFIFVSAACERIFGYTPDELIGTNMIDLVYPEDRDRTLHTAGEIMKDKPVSHFENRYVRKDGRVVHVMWSARWSEPDGIRLAVARDVTELRRAERMQSALYQISEAAHATTSLYDLYQHIHRIIGRLLPARNFSVALYDVSTDQLSFPYSVDENPHISEADSFDSHNFITGIIQSGQAHLTTSEISLNAVNESLDWLGVPLMSADIGVMGALIVRSYASDMRYTNEDVELLQFVSTQIASAIERKQAEAQLQHMARHDALTDLPNRTLFFDRLDMALKRARRDREQLAVLYLDLNDFKTVNDTLGHEAGDMLLCQVAHRLLQCVRESDTVGRLGGDEFTILLTNIKGQGDVETVLEKIHATLSALYSIKDNSVSLSASIGSAIYPEQGATREQLVQYADMAMYAYKRTE